MSNFFSQSSKSAPDYPLVFLLGFMGAGKSTFGRPVARNLGWKFIDLDEEIEARFGKRISEIFVEKGEAYFRKIERKTLESLIDNQEEATLLSCGGGTPCFGDTMDWMNQRGITCYLKPSNSILLGRLRQMRASRPMISHLSEEELGEFIEALLQKRESYYLQAQVILEGAQLNKVEIIKAIQKEVANPTKNRL